MSQKEFAKLYQEIKTFPQPKALKYLILIRTYCNSDWLPDDQQMIDTFGLELFTTLRFLQNKANSYYPRGNLLDEIEKAKLDKFCGGELLQKMRNWREDHFKQLLLFDVMIMCVKDFAKEKGLDQK